MPNSNMFNIDKLNGRDNFSTWKFSVKTYLEHEDLWSCIEPGTGTVDPVKDVRAKSKLILLINTQNYIHVQECNTAREVWDNLHKAFDDNGLTRRVSLLKELINTSLEASENVEDYISKIMNAAHKLRSIGFEVNDEWLGTLMLAGLSEEYKPMIMGLENSGLKIGADFIKTKLLQEVKTENSSNAFYSNSKKMNENSKSRPSGEKMKGPRCYNCNGYGHFAKFCKKTKKTQNKGKERKEDGFIAAFSASSEKNSEKWYIDSGASMHMCSNKEWLCNVREPPVKTITVANREPLPVECVGDISINISQHNKIQVRNVLYVPGLAVNLLSVSMITKYGYRVSFSEKGCNIEDTTGKLLCSATLINKLYILDTNVSNKESAHLVSNKVNPNDINLWHLRMAHLNVSALKKLPDCAEGVSLTHGRETDMQCSTCLEGKQTRLPFKHTGSRATRPLEVIHSDLCGPMENPSYGGMRYFVSFIDDYSRMVHIYFMKDKQNVLDVFKDFKNKVENQLNHKIKIIRTDNGKEYCNLNFEKYLTNCGITHQTSAPYSPQQNGLAERMNRTLVEKARCMIFYAKLDKPMWAEAVATAAYLVNRSPTKVLGNTTPYKMWTGKEPKLSHVRIFGSKAMVHVPKEKRTKWDKKSREMILVGYCENTKGYRVMNPMTHQVTKSRDVVFFESVNEINECSISVNPIVDVPVEGHSSTEQPKESVITPQSAASHELSENSSEYETDSADLDETYQPPRYLMQQDQQISNITLRPRNKFHKDKEVLFCFYNSVTDPQNVEEALSSPHANEWKKAMDEEYNSLIETETWQLEDLPAGKKALTNKWVFKTKTDQQGNVIRYKARLVIRGYEQKRGIDYQEVYSPVVRYTSIRYLFAVAAQCNLHIDQMDAVTAFLQGNIDAEIYMVQPEMYAKGKQVCHLLKSIYGLKQASRLWNIKLCKVLKELGIEQSKTDPCIYYDNTKKIYIAVWVDDLIIFSSQLEYTKELKEKLCKKLNMKDLGRVKQCVGLNITRGKDTIMIDQEKYIKEVLSRFNMTDCKTTKTPVEVGLKFSNMQEDPYDCPYQQAIGCLLFIAQGTRPDISFAVNCLSRYNKEPKSEHWAAVKRVLRYLQGTKHYRLTYTKNGESEIMGYCDADWASDIRDRRSCTGYIFMLQGGAVSWCSRKQQTVALSTAEAEYMAMSSAAQEALWLQQLQGELGGQRDGTLVIHSDNISAIKLTANDCYLPRSKHIDIKYHFLREHVSSLKLKFFYVKSEENVSDILTKGTSVDKHYYCMSNMGLRSGVGDRIGTQPN